MLDFFAVLSKGGFVLWCYTFQGIKTNISEPVNALIKSVILQARGESSRFDHGQLTMKYKLDNEFELVFVVGYQKILSLTYIDKFVDDVHRSFRDLYRQKLENSGFVKLVKEEFEYRDKFLKMLKAAEVVKVQTKMKAFDQSEKSKKTVKSLIEDKKDKAQSKSDKENIAPESQASPKSSPKPGKIANGNSLSPEEIKRNIEAKLKRGKKKTDKPSKRTETKPKGKQDRIWETGGTAKDLPVLDYSSPKDKVNGDSTNAVLVTGRQELLDADLAMVGTGGGDIKGLEVDDGDYGDVKNDGEDEEVEQRSVPQLPCSLEETALSYLIFSSFPMPLKYRVT